MSDHDPLCVWYNPSDTAAFKQPEGASGCTCKIRRQTRADERKRIAAEPCQCNLCWNKRAAKS